MSAEERYTVLPHVFGRLIELVDQATDLDVRHASLHELEHNHFLMGEAVATAPDVEWEPAMSGRHKMEAWRVAWSMEVWNPDADPNQSGYCEVSDAAAEYLDQIGEAMDADRTLGGAVNWVRFDIETMQPLIASGEVNFVGSLIQVIGAFHFEGGCRA